MKTEELINLLVHADDRPVTQIQLVRRGFWIIGFATLLTAVFFFSFVPLRAGLSDRGIAMIVARKVLVTLSAMICGGILLWKGSQPTGAAPRLWLVAFVPLFFALASVGFELVQDHHDWLARTVGNSGLRCLTSIAILAAVPLAAVMWLAKEGAPANPRLAGFAAGLLAGGIGATIYAFFCLEDSALFVAAWYSGAIVGMAVLGSAFGHKALRW